MLESWRYNRALEANAKQPESSPQDIFLSEEYKTQFALKQLGIKDAISPSEVPHVGTILMAPELISNLRVPYAVEVLGMPRSGKSTVINRYLSELWGRKERHKVHLVGEGARTIKDEFGDLRYSDPFQYSMLGGTVTFAGYINALRHVNTGMRMVTSDRGQIDRCVFRRTLFNQGHVNPEIMADEPEFMYGLENTPIQIGGIIMLMIRPEESMRRSERSGPVNNMDFLPRLYEQYWRLHWDILQGEFPYRIYTCIDAEKDSEEVYERFKYAMDNALNIHSIYLAALAKAFPEKFDKAKAEHDNSPRQQSRAQQVLGEKLGGKRVLIVGGDEMETKEEMLQKPFIEGIKLK